jgi:hypothetical protein
VRTPPRRRNAALLWAVVLLVGAVDALFRLTGGLTGAPLIDGAVEVVVGLYACSHPAANALDALYHVGDVEHISLGDVAWVLLNGLVLLVGYLAIVAGASRFVG